MLSFFSLHSLKLNRLQKFSLFTTCSFISSLSFLAYPAFAQDTTGGGFNPQQWLLNALQWIDSLGAVGAIAFMILYMIAAVAFLPGSILTLGAGVVFGVIWGSIYVFFGATIGYIF